MLEHTDSTLVAVSEHNDAPEGYYPKIRFTGLFEATSQSSNKRYYMSIIPHGCSKTWLTDEEASRMFDIILNLSNI